MPSAEQFLRQKFREFYSKGTIDSVPAIEQREFGIGEFGRKISNRHLAFKNPADLNSYLRNSTPFYISYSPAYYKFPDRKPMDAKQLLKSDIVYEFDADDIKTECKQQHDSWQCGKCKATGKGAIENCTSCMNPVEIEQWVCNSCLEVVKKQVFSLLEILNNDFGISEGISINYSGSKGYHIHIRNSSFQPLSSKARIELVDYITTNDLDFSALGFYLNEDKKFICPKLSTAKGWQKKLLSKTIELFSKADEAELAVAGSTTMRELKKNFPDRQKIISELQNGTMHQLPGKKTEKFWFSLLNYSLGQLKLKIDRQTSVDMVKIIRVPNTLHGSTGLIAKAFPIESLKNFQPLDDTIAFGQNPVKLKISKAPKFSLNRQEFGPFEQAEAELPEFAAVYLLARGNAELV